MNKGTVVYIGGFELPDKNAAAHRVLSNAKVFRELGYNVVFIDVYKTTQKYSDLPYIKKEIQGFECWSIKYPKTRNQWFKYLTSIENFKKIANNYNDIKYVVAYNYQAIAFLKIRKYCKNRDIKLIGDCTEWYDAKGNGIVFYIIKSLDSYLRMKVIHTKIDGLIVISKYLQDYYIKRGVKNIINIPPLVDKSEKKWSEIKKINHEDRVTLVYAGTPGKCKDKLNYIIEALYNLQNEEYLLKILGIDKNEYLEVYPHHKELLIKLDKNINFYGRVDHLFAIENIKMADFTIFIRDINRVTLAGFPTKLVESISCGTPVITNSSSDFKEFIVNEKNGFLINDDLNKEIETILKINKNELKSMKKNIESNIFDYNNYKKIFKEIL